MVLRWVCFFGARRATVEREAARHRASARRLRRRTRSQYTCRHWRARLHRGTALERRARRLRPAASDVKRRSATRVRAPVEGERARAQVAGEGARGQPQGQPRRRRARADQLLRWQARRSRARRQGVAARVRARQPVAREGAGRCDPPVRRRDRSARRERRAQRAHAAPPRWPHQADRRLHHGPRQAGQRSLDRFGPDRAELRWDENGIRYRIVLRKEDGEWRIDDIYIRPAPKDEEEPKPSDIEGGQEDF